MGRYRRALHPSTVQKVGSRLRSCGGICSRCLLLLLLRGCPLVGGSMMVHGVYNCARTFCGCQQVNLTDIFGLFTVLWLSWRSCRWHGTWWETTNLDCGHWDSLLMLLICCVLVAKLWSTLLWFLLLRCREEHPADVLVAGGLRSLFCVVSGGRWWYGCRILMVWSSCGDCRETCCACCDWDGGGG